MRQIVEPILTCYIVICRFDSLPSGEKGGYTVAARTLFRTCASAMDFAKTVSASREPRICPVKGIVFDESEYIKVPEEEVVNG